MSAARTFGVVPFAAPGVSTQSLGKPAAAYPAAVATDSDMIIAVDLQQTRLALPLNPTDTSMTVTDPSIIVAYNLLSIDSEIVKSTGAPVGNVVPISRGFDGTAPALHLASAVVSGRIDAYHHNRLVAEIEAIQSTLGPNLSRVPTSGVKQVSSYNFPPQFPGVTLTPGTNVITMTPVPLGVNGADQNHYLYVDQGTGTAEKVLITGGSAVSGAASGTLFFTCSNAHSGAWRISSATGGIQECVIDNPWSLIQLSSGPCDLYSQVTLNPHAGYIIRGSGFDPFGVNGTVLRIHDTTGNQAGFYIVEPTPAGNATQQLVYFSDFAMYGSDQNGNGFTATGINRLVIERVLLSHMGKRGIYCSSCIGAVLRDNLIYHSQLHGIHIDATCHNTRIEHNSLADNGYVDGQANLLIGGGNINIVVEDNDMEYAGGGFAGASANPGVTQSFGILATQVSGLTITNNYFEGAIPTSSHMIYTTGSKGIVIEGNYIQDGLVTIDGAVDVRIGVNTWYNTRKPTGWNVDQARDQTVFDGRQTIFSGSAAVTFTPAPAGTATASAGVATLHAQQGTITSEALATAAGSTYSLTLLDVVVGSNSVIMASAQLGSSTQGTPQIVSVTPGSDSAVIVVKNIHATLAFNGTIKIQFVISNIG